MNLGPEALQAFVSSEALQPVRDALDALSAGLRQRPDVMDTTVYHPESWHTANWRSFGWGVLAELHNNARVDFYIDLDVSQCPWAMEITVQRGDPDEDGTHSEQVFAHQDIHSMDQLPDILLSAIASLRQASSNVKLFR